MSRRKITGRSEFIDETNPPLPRFALSIFFGKPGEKEPDCPACTVAVIYHQRPWENGHELGGWFALLVTADSTVDDAGPFATLAEADRIGRRMAERHGCDFIPATAEEINEATADLAQLRIDQAADEARDPSSGGGAA